MQVTGHEDNQAITAAKIIATISGIGKITGETHIKGEYYIKGDNVLGNKKDIPIGMPDDKEIIYPFGKIL